MSHTKPARTARVTGLISDTEYISAMKKAQFMPIYFSGLKESTLIYLLGYALNIITPRYIPSICLI